jgi:hypothetical protein
MDPFLFNSISHTILSILYGLKNKSYINSAIENSDLWNRYHGIIAFGMGHMFIASAQALLNDKYNDNTSLVTILGSIGHILLIIYIIWVIAYQGISLLPCIFAIGQILMIYFYNNHQLKDKVIFQIKKEGKEGESKIKNRDIFITGFVLMSIYYFIAASREPTFFQYALALIGVVYINLIFIVK